MFRYTDNTDLIKEIKKMIIDNNTTQKKVSCAMGVSIQQLHNILKKKNLSFFDVDHICKAAGVDLFICFQKNNDNNDNNNDNEIKTENN